MASIEETPRYHKKQAFIGFGLMCLSTSLFNALETSIPPEIQSHPLFITLALFILLPGLLVLWSMGLSRWIDQLGNLSTTTCNNSLIGGLIVANIGLVYVAFGWGIPVFDLQIRLVNVLWPTYFGMLAGYWWE